MAKKSIIAREKKRSVLHEKYSKKMQDIKAKLASGNLSPEDAWQLRLKMQKFPNNSYSSRLTSRCFLTGRAHAVYSRFGLSRIKIREYAMRGEVPGIIKSSW